MELERQRKIRQPHHDGPQAHLRQLSRWHVAPLRGSSLEFEPRMMDGKHHTEILKDLAGSATWS